MKSCLGIRVSTALRTPEEEEEEEDCAIRASVRIRPAVRR
jgi:hypothetical protein